MLFVLVAVLAVAIAVSDGQCVTADGAAFYDVQAVAIGAENVDFWQLGHFTWNNGTFGPPGRSRSSGNYTGPGQRRMVRDRPLPYLHQATRMLPILPNAAPSEPRASMVGSSSLLQLGRERVAGPEAETLWVAGVAEDRRLQQRARSLRLHLLTAGRCRIKDVRCVGRAHRTVTRNVSRPSRVCPA